MGPAYFVIAILGCADGGSACTPVATLQTQYASEAQCAAASGAALIENSNFDYPDARAPVPARPRPRRPRPTEKPARQARAAS